MAPVPRIPQWILSDIMVMEAGSTRAAVSRGGIYFARRKTGKDIEQEVTENGGTFTAEIQRHGANSKVRGRSGLGSPSDGHHGEAGNGVLESWSSAGTRNGEFAAKERREHNGDEFNREISERDGHRKRNNNQLNHFC